MTLTLQELKEKILENYDPDDIVDALQITTEQLLDRFEDELLEYRYKFEDVEDEE